MAGTCPSTSVANAVLILIVYFRGKDTINKRKMQVKHEKTISRTSKKVYEEV